MQNNGTQISNSRYVSSFVKSNSSKEQQKEELAMELVNPRAIVMNSSVGTYSLQKNIIYSFNMLSGEHPSNLSDAAREIRFNLACKKVDGEPLKMWQEQLLNELNRSLSVERELSASLELKEHIQYLESVKALYLKE